MTFTLYHSGKTGVQANNLYPNQVEIKDENSLKQAVQFDHVMASYKDNKRSKDNFLSSNCLPFDCDNDHSDDSEDWITPLEVAMEFPDVRFYVVYSRNNNKEKNGISARPRFHAYFPTEEITEVEIYANLKKEVASRFGYFDDNALDVARFLFGTQDPQIEFYQGTQTIDDFIVMKDFENWEDSLNQISQGNRNSAMSKVAGKLIKRFGISDKAHDEFIKYSEKCQPPLSNEELQKIWQSAIRFGEKISSNPNYIPPDQFNSESQLKPSDFSDVGQAIVLEREYEGILRYSPSTDYIVYNGSYWEESAPKATAVAILLTERQLDEAELEIAKITQEMVANGALDILISVGPKKAQTIFNTVQQNSYAKYEQAQQYKKYAIKRRDDKYLSSVLRVARPKLEISQRILDVDEFALNTPSATYDLRTTEKKEHSPSDFITKQTEVDPDEENQELWLEALQTIFCTDQELIDYVQMIVGLSVIGKVYVEALIISYGEGRNGKSTFWNLIARVLGNYSGTISADMLTTGCKRNVKPELAEAKGKRLLIAAELEEGMRLNTSNIKQLCSTDEITAEKKYKDPFKYIPSHTLVLYTNHLPKIGAIDEGTWRRLIVVPFLAKIEGDSDIKNYADFLFENAGGAVLSWILVGAKKVIASNYRIELPEKVKEAIQKYKENNDWLAHFLNDCCELDNSYREKSGELYSEYRAYCVRTGEYTRSSGDFTSALEGIGMERKKTSKGNLIVGLKLKSEFL